MATTYYICPFSGATVFDDNDPPLSTPIDTDNVTPCVEVDEATYLAAIADREYDSALFGQVILASRSINRSNALILTGATIDTGKLYGVWLPDNLLLGITQVEWKLDTISVNTELTAPWDYWTTGPGDTTNRGVFLPGTHLVEAVVTHSSGIHTVSATFEVD